MQATCIIRIVFSSCLTHALVKRFRFWIYGNSGTHPNRHDCHKTRQQTTECDQLSKANHPFCFKDFIFYPFSSNKSWKKFFKNIFWKNSHFTKTISVLFLTPLFIVFMSLCFFLYFISACTPNTASKNLAKFSHFTGEEQMQNLSKCFEIKFFF